MRIGVPYAQESTQERHKQSIPATMRGERSTGSTAAHLGIAQASRETRRLAEPLPGGLRDDAGGGCCTQKREEFRSEQELADHVDLNDRLKPILRLLSGVPRRAAAPSVEAQHVEPLQASTIRAAFAFTQGGGKAAHRAQRFQIERDAWHRDVCPLHCRKDGLLASLRLRFEASSRRQHDVKS